MSVEVDFVKINGVDVPLIFEMDRKLPIASMQLVFLNSGSAEDNCTAGLAKFSSNMLTEGTNSINAADFAKMLEEKAIDFHVSAGVETIVFELSSLKEEFEFGVLMLKKVLIEPNISENAFEKVYAETKGVILDKKSDFDYIANVKLKSMMYKDSCFGEPNIGTEKSIKQIDRKKVEKFIKEHLNLSNLILVAGGDLEKEKFKKLLIKTLSILDVGEKKALPFYEVSKLQKSEIQLKKAEQAYIYFAAPLELKYNDDKAYIAKVASFILGESGFGSRLMDEIRVKRGLAYSAYSRFSMDKTTSSFIGYLQTKIDSKDEAVKIVKDVVKNFTQNGATQKELDQAKRFLIGSEPLRVETLSQRLSRAFYEYYRDLGFGYFKTELANIEKLTLEELNDFIKSRQEINLLMFSVVTNDNSKKSER